jgi:hypothetical protein
MRAGAPEIWPVLGAVIPAGDEVSLAQDQLQAQWWIS